MPTFCECNAFYGDLGLTDIYRIYLNGKQVWPCYGCSVDTDSEYLKDVYRDAEFYIPSVCMAQQTTNEPDFDPQVIKDAISGINLTKGPGFNGVLLLVGGSYRFLAPYLPDQYEENIVEGSLPKAVNFGLDKSSLSCYLYLNEPMQDQYSGPVIKIGNMWLEVVWSLNNQTKIRGRIKKNLDNDIYDIIVTSNSTFPVGEKIRVLFNHVETDTGVFVGAYLYFNDVMVGKVEA